MVPSILSSRHLSEFKPRRLISFHGPFVFLLLGAFGQRLQFETRLQLFPLLFLVNPPFLGAFHLSFRLNVFGPLLFGLDEISFLVVARLKRGRDATVGFVKVEEDGRVDRQQREVGDGGSGDEGADFIQTMFFRGRQCEAAVF